MRKGSRRRCPRWHDWFGFLVGAASITGLTTGMLFGVIMR